MAQYRVIEHPRNPTRLQLDKKDTPQSPWEKIMILDINEFTRPLQFLEDTPVVQFFKADYGKTQNGFIDAADIDTYVSAVENFDDQALLYGISFEFLTQGIFSP